MLWIPITLAAATCQILRTSRQHELRSLLSTGAAGFVRYLYGAPLALALSVVVFVGLGRDLPAPTGDFWWIVTLAGAAQIVATVALLQSFKLRAFAIGTVYSKSEVILVAVVSAVALDEPLQPLGWIGAVLVMVGVAWLASGGSLTALLRRAGDPAALMGIAAGGLFACAAVGIRAASGELGDGPAFDRALVTLTAMLVIQTLVNGAWFATTDTRQITDTVRAWRPAIAVGVLSLLGSIGWAWAVTLENAAKVRTLGQVEVVIAFAIAYTRLGERHSRSDLAASALVLAGVLTVMLFG